MTLPINFRNDYFRIELENITKMLLHQNVMIMILVLTLFQLFRMSMLHQRNVLWANHGNFLTKQLRNASMKRPKLPNGFLEGKNDTSQSAQEKQCKLCEKPLRNIKEQFFLNLDPELIAENKKF